MEPVVGYSRAVRKGPFVSVAGTTSVDQTTGEPVHRGDAYQQAKFIFKIITAALKEVGAAVEDVIRTRMFVVDITSDWEAVGRAHGEIFGEIRPAASMIEVQGLIHPDILVEIEVDAVVG